MPMWKFFVLATRATLCDSKGMKHRLTLGVALMLLASCVFVSFAAKKDNAKESSVVRVLIIDGQNNHNWKETTPVLEKIFGSNERFSLDVSTSPGNKAVKE